MRQEAEAAIQEGKAKREQSFGLRYVRFSDDYRELPRGTVLFEEALIPGYPQIGRIVVLRSGLAEQFHGSFWAEEKVNGFNVRIAKVGDRILAFSRGGFICPFTTDRVGDLLDLTVFEEAPDLVVCAEVAGPENPYHEGSPPFIPADVQLFTFDLMRHGSARFLNQEEKMKLIDRYRLPATTIFGQYNRQNIDELESIGLRLDREGKEGIVFKEVGSQKRAKYVVGQSNIQDINDAAINLMDVHSSFFMDRILRLALFLDEHELEPSRAIKEQLGGAFLDQLSSALEQYRGTHHVSHRFKCRFRSYENASYFIESLQRIRKQGVQTLQRRLEQEGEFWVLEFERVSTRMVGLLGHSLGGGVTYD